MNPPADCSPPWCPTSFTASEEIKERVSLLIAEQNVRQCLKAIDRGYVIENGRIVMEEQRPRSGRQ